MKIIKGLLWAALTLSIFAGFALLYLLQPAGKLEQFSAWQYSTKTLSANLKVHYFGVSTLLFDDGENQILIDGFFSRLSCTTPHKLKKTPNSPLYQPYL